MDKVLGSNLPGHLSSLAELSSCADAMTGWHITNNLLLNCQQDGTCRHGHTTAGRQIRPIRRQHGARSDGIPVIAKLGVFGVISDGHLSSDEHIAGVVRAWLYRMRALAIHPPGYRPGYGELDDCNSIFYVVSESNINRLRREQNALLVVCAAVA